MIRWLFSSCTLDPLAKGWIEGRWKWLIEQFGRGVLLNSPTVEPTAEFFPDEYDRSDESVRALVQRVSSYMGVASCLIDVEFYSSMGPSYLINDEGFPISPGPVGTYHQKEGDFSIRIDRSQFDRPMELVGTVAHEFAHFKLMGEGRIDPDSFDNELTTDLTAVFHGLGIFLANVPRAWFSEFSVWPGTDVKRPQYMTSAMYGYALALRCSQRNELLPRWRTHLKPPVRAEFRQSLRFLSRTAPKRP